MKLIDYIEKREEALDRQLEKITEQDTINVVSVAVVNSAVAELERIKMAIEDGAIDSLEKE